MNILLAVLAVIPISLFFISAGLMFGSILSVKQVGAVCGALLTNLTAWLSGVWFDLDLVGGAFRKIAYALPFVHAVELESSLGQLRGRYAASLVGCGIRAAVHISRGTAVHKADEKIRFRDMALRCVSFFVHITPMSEISLTALV